ncbi:MAG: GAF domain-containing protein [Acidimicrobiia bacterium]|nr:GAF domain-containing protein [Acidimicrobiia bacterium]NNF88263.1 GAF domain-containing protein [Acidimicrobiia bacterium]
MAELTFPTKDAEGEQRLLAEALGDVAAALSSTLELEDVLDLILDRASRVVPYSIGTVLLVEGDRAEVVRARGYPDSMIGVGFPLTKLWRRLIETGVPVVVDDTRLEPDWTVTEEANEVRSAAVVGIHSGGQVIGFLCLDSVDTGSYTVDQAHRLQAFADYAGNAIHNARLYHESQSALEAMREQRRLTQVLADISAELTMQRDVDDLLDYILGRMSGFFAGAAVSVMLIEGGEAEVVRSTPGEKAAGERLTIADLPNLRAVVDTQRPFLIADTRADATDWVVREDTSWIRSNLTAPIKLRGKAIGFLSLSSAEPGAFPAALFEPLEAFSNHVGIALQNARMFAESETARSAAQEERSLAEALADVSAALSSTLELEDVLDLILDRAARVVPYAIGTVLMVEGDQAEVIRARGYPDSMLGVSFPLTNLFRRLIETGEPVVVHDTRSEPGWIVTEEAREVRSAAVVGIHAEGQVIGFISLDSVETGSFTLTQAHRLQAFGDHAGNAIRNARLFQESQAERQQTDLLLRAILPDKIAAELKANGRVQARRHECVAVLFADIVGFTEYCDTHDPEEVLDALTKITLRFEEISELHGLEKIKTIGDSFMAATGLLSPMLNPDLQCVKAGFEMIAACHELGPKWSVRIGIHSGDLVSGVLGNKKFLFDIWGDTVNTASRVESNGVPDCVCVSRGSWNRIAHACQGRSRGMIDVKGKGEIEMFLVEGLR